MTEQKEWKDETLVGTYLEGIKDGFPLRSAQFEVMLRLIKSTGREVCRVLDIGAGDGSVASVILGRYPKVEAVLIDFSAPMLEAARKKFDAGGFNAQIIEADFSEQDWLKSVGGLAPFDVIVSSYAIHHLGDERKRALYEEVLKSLAPGGIFINIDRVSSLSDWGAKAAHEYLMEGLRAHHKEQGTFEVLKRVEDVVERAHSSESDILAPVEEQCRWLRKAGFIDVDCYLKAFEHALFAGRRS